MFTLNNITESAPAITDRQRRIEREARPARRAAKFNGETLEQINARIDAGDHVEYRLTNIVEV